MECKFRNELLEKNESFKKIFNELLEKGDIREYPKELWDIINTDRTAIKINGEPLAFKDLFKKELTEGRCMYCVFEFLLLLDKLGIYSEAIRCTNDYFVNTKGSSYGGHWFLEVHFKTGIEYVDTSLMVIGTFDAFKKIGHNVIKKYDIDTLFKEYPELIDIHEDMIINKHFKLD